MLNLEDKKEDKKEEGKDKKDKEGPQKRNAREGQAQNLNMDEIAHDYEAWEKKNNNSITKIIVNYFPKYFLFFAFCVGF